MRRLGKKAKPTTIISAISIFIIGIGMLAALLWGTDSRTSQWTEVRLDDHWTITVHGKTYEDVSLSAFTTDICNRGDEMELTSVIPENAPELFRPTLLLYSVHSRVLVELDGEEIYNYEYHDVDPSQFIGYGYHYVALPDHYAGKTLHIKFLVTENNAFEGVPTITIRSEDYTFLMEMNRKRINISISLFLIVFGFFATMVSAYEITKSQAFSSVFSIALLSFAAGVWTLCNSDAVNYFTPNLRAKVYLEYLSFYFMPIPFTYYFRERATSENQPKVVRKLFWVIVTCELVFYVTTCICQFLNIAHFPVFLATCHMFLLIAGLLVIVLIINEYRRTHHFEKASSIGFSLALVLIISELIRFNLQKYITGFEGNYYTSTLGLSVTIIVITLLIDFLELSRKNLVQTAQQELLQEMAYTDDLTGLCNRRACEQMASQLDKDAAPYTVIDFDLNRLKYINDNFGHETGDEAICQFATILKRAFANPKYRIGRTGGDEFVVIIPFVDKTITQNEIDLFDTYIIEENEKGLKYPFSASYGVSYSTEFKSTNFSTVWEKADERMYLMKRKMKMERKD